MKIEKFKSEHPELYAEVLALGAESNAKPMTQKETALHVLNGITAAKKAKEIELFETAVDEKLRINRKTNN